jgi:hypothetical protein
MLAVVVAVAYQGLLELELMVVVMEMLVLET